MPSVVKAEIKFLLLLEAFRLTGFQKAYGAETPLDGARAILNLNPKALFLLLEESLSQRAPSGQTAKLDILFERMQIRKMIHFSLDEMTLKLIF